MRPGAHRRGNRKGQRTPVGYQVSIELRWSELPKGHKITSSGAFVFEGIEEPIGYFLNGKKYRCKEIPDDDAGPEWLTR